MIKPQRIISLRGTHGSGKSTVVFKILEKYGSAAYPIKDAKGRPWGRDVKLPTGDMLTIIGRYDTACGGCDGIQPYSDIWPRIESAANRQNHVIFEGALVSSSYGEIGRSTEQYGDKVVFAFLDTPLQVCLERVAARRIAKGNLQPLNPANTIKKFESIERSRVKIEREFQRRVERIDHERPVAQILKFFGVHLRKEP